MRLVTRFVASGHDRVLQGKMALDSDEPASSHYWKATSGYVYEEMIRGRQGAGAKTRIPRLQPTLRELLLRVERLIKQER